MNAFPFLLDNSTGNAYILSRSGRVIHSVCTVCVCVCVCVCLFVLMIIFERNGPQRTHVARWFILTPYISQVRLGQSSRPREEKNHRRKTSSAIGLHNKQHKCMTSEPVKASALRVYKQVRKTFNTHQDLIFILESGAEPNV